MNEIRKATVSDSDTEIVLHSFMSLKEAAALCHRISAVVKETLPAPDVVIGVANGGTLPAFIVASDLRAPLKIVNVRRRGSGLKQKLKVVLDFLRIPTGIFFHGPLRWIFEKFQSSTSDLTEISTTFDFPVDGQHVLIVDDSIVSGKTIEYIRRRFSDNGASRVSVAVLSCADNIDRPGITEPEIVVNTVFQFFPWSNNSPHWRDYIDFMRQNKLEIWN
jgi:hypoxanthine phosphoribosyltransferase